jgi:hypothetical protein
MFNAVYGRKGLTKEQNPIVRSVTQLLRQEMHARIVVALLISNVGHTALHMH